MSKKEKIAIVGAGAVGSTAAYYLSQDSNLEITVFDYGHGQATKAAAGIISPWFSKRRNKAWYKLARLGADFYPDLVADLEKTGADTSFYQQTGVYLLKKNEEKLQELLDLALSRLEESPIIGQIKLLKASEAQEKFPGLQGFVKLLYASGGARVEGAKLTQTLLSASQLTYINKEVQIQPLEEGYRIDGQIFDKVILATVAWLGQILTPLGFKVDVRPQKGQLRDYYFENLNTDAYPVVMPEGEIDIIPFDNGKISLGASHENDKSFDLTLNQGILDSFQNQAQTYFPHFEAAEQKSARVGIRAYTSDFSPFFGQIAELPGLYVASGLGSTGLTIGPFIGNQLAKMVLGQLTQIAPADYPTNKYIKKSN